MDHVPRGERIVGVALFEDLLGLAGWRRFRPIARATILARPSWRRRTIPRGRAMRIDGAGSTALQETAALAVLALHQDAV
jgi:hypothetical protein